jgi:hypothetical protein
MLTTHDPRKLKVTLLCYYSSNLRRYRDKGKGVLEATWPVLLAYKSAVLGEDSHGYTYYTIYVSEEERGRLWESCSWACLRGTMTSDPPPKDTPLENVNSRRERDELIEEMFKATNEVG